MNKVAIGETRHFYPGKLKWGMVSLTGLLFTAGGVLMISQKNEAMSWFVMLFSLAGAIVGLMQLFGKGSCLTLDREGFRVKQFGRDRGLVHWTECSGFGVAVIASNKMIVYDRVQDEGKALASINRAIAGGSAALPDTYGMKPQKLADLMNAYRDKAFYNDLN